MSFSGDINSSFNVDPDVLFAYFCTDEYINLASFVIKSNINKLGLEFINKLKRKYGSYFKDLMISSKNPYLLKLIQTSIEGKGQTHLMKFIRADETEFNAMYTCESLMQSITSLTNALQLSMERGTYYIEDEIVLSYTETNKKLEIFLESIKEKKEDIIV